MTYIIFIFNKDITITTKKLVELFGTVNERQLVDRIGIWLRLPGSKREEVRWNYQSLTQRRDAYLDLYVSHHPYPSWKTVTEALRGVDLHHQADVVEWTYVQGMIVTTIIILGTSTELALLAQSLLGCAVILCRCSAPCGYSALMEMVVKSVFSNRAHAHPGRPCD